MMTTLFVLGLMPAVIGLQFFMARSTKQILWHMGVGLLWYLPFVVIRGLVLNAGLRADNMTFISQWLTVFILDYLLVLLYLLPLLWVFIHSKIFVRDTVYVASALATFFFMDSIVFVMFQSMANGAYELLLRPAYYLGLLSIISLGVQRIQWYWAVGLAVFVIIAPMSDAFLFLNQQVFTLVTIIAAVATAMGTLLLMRKQPTDDRRSHV